MPALVIVAAALWVFWPALHGDWLWDDDHLVTDNSNLRSWYGLGEIWFGVPTSDYWPLTWTLLWLEWHLWGNAPLGYHLCSLALHITSGFLIWRLFRRLGLRHGWLGGLLFVTYPLAVESVAWISEIKNTFSLPFYLLALEAWMDGEDGRRSGYRRSIFYYLAAMLAKTSTVMLPAVLVLYCWWKRGRVTAQEFKRTIPYGVLALIFGLATVYFQNNGRDSNPQPELGGIARLMGAGTAFFFYLGKFILPVNLLPIYPQWTLAPPSLVEMLALPALAGLLFGLWTQRSGWGRHALFGLGFFLLNLLPVLGLVKMQYMSISWVADHFVYLPMIGLVGLVVAGVGEVAGRDSASLRPAVWGATTLLMAWLMWQSHAYAALFINQETLWTYTLQRNPEAWPARDNLGITLIQAGRASEGIEQIEQAVRLAPNDVEAHTNLGTALLDAGQVAGAAAQFQRALEIEPEFAEAYYGLGLVMLRSGRYFDAIDRFTEALQRKANYAEAHNNLGYALANAGRPSEAVEQYDEALRLKPDLAEAHYNLGNALAQAGQFPDAIQEFQQAIVDKPDYAEAHNNLGTAFIRMGRLGEAIAEFEQAVRIKPDYALAQENLRKLQSAAPGH